MSSIDINCDMGESFGLYQLGQDEKLMDYVSSVNIACGFHAGDPAVMRKTVDMAVRKKIAIGAHPGYPDLQGFGRREMKLSENDIYDIVLYQIGALNAFVCAAGATLHHVKPHGALYNTAALNSPVATAIARAVKDANENLVFVGLSGSVMIAEARKLGLRTASEVFADRTYQDDGTLTPRHLPNAMKESPEQAAAQVLQMVKGTVTTTSGKNIPVIAETVCIHGDGKSALEFAKAIAHLLQENHVIIKQP
ncbi:MAG: LamB/YcsF family protein [Bacteroidota bacterium]